MRKGHAVTGEVPVWLQRLRRLRQREGRPLIEAIATSANLSEAVVLNVFTGRTEPHRPELVLIVEALTGEQQEIDKVLRAYDDRNEPPPPLPDVPDWLALLRVERHERGQPSLRELGTRSGLSHGHVGDIFKGRSLPSLDTLMKLLGALTEDMEAQMRIQDAYEVANTPKRSFPELDFDARSETRVLADAMLSLAQAMIDLAASIDNYRANQQDRNQPPD